MISDYPPRPKKVFSKLQLAGYNTFQFFDHFLTRKVTVKLFGKLRYRLFSKMLITLKASGEGKIYQVDYRNDLSLEEFKNYYVKKGIPVVFKGGAKNWNCVKSWTLDYFKELHGSDKVPLIDSVDPDKGVEYMSLEEVINQINSGNNQTYFRFYNILEQHPEHIEDFDLSWLQKHSHRFKYFERFQAFIGGGKSMTEIHNAHIANLFVQAYGEKHWFLHPHDYVPIIDPPSTLNGLYRNAPNRAGKPFNPFYPDFEGYPYWKYLDAYEVKLETGDILYNPPYMWHTVRNETNSIGVGYRWINPWHSFKSGPLYYLLDLLAYRPNYFSSLNKIRQDGNKQFIDRYAKANKVKPQASSQIA